MKKISAYIGAFILLICVFFTAGICSLGSVFTGGESVFVGKDTAVYFSLLGENGAVKNQTVDDVYVKVGTVYQEVDENVTLTVALSSSATSSNATTSSQWPSANKKNLSFKTVSDGEQYNWIKVFDGAKQENMKALSFKTSANLELIEIVCLDETGKIIPLQGFLAKDITAFELTDVAKAYDAQKSFEKSESAFYNLTVEEGYYLTSAKTLLSGREVLSDCTYILDENFNYLNTVLIAGSVVIFGASAFAVRLPAFLATCTLILFAFLLMKDMFKSEKYAFVGGLLLCFGGMATTLGRVGAPYAIVASAIIASVYFMYRFFSKGISSSSVVKDGANILYSGLFAAVALSIDGAAIFPVIGVLVLFVFGLRRQKAAYKLALAKAEAQGGEDFERKAARMKSKYEEKNRISYGFASLSFVMGTLFLSFLSAVLCYAAFVKANGNVDLGFGRLLFDGWKNSLFSGAVAPYAAENASNAFSWFLPWKAATLYTGGNGEEYLAWSVLPNAVVCLFSLIALVATTFKVAKDFVVKTQDKKALRVRRAYFILLVGLAVGMIAAACKMHVSVLNAYLFESCYAAFIPFAAVAFSGENGKKSKLLDIAVWLIVALAVAVFVISIPSAYGFAVPFSYAKAFGWTAIVNNGFFR